MAIGKFRSESHLIDQKAVSFVRENLPTEWVVRELTPDYGLDLDVEVFEKENGRITTLGERLYLQVKGTTMANYIDVTYGTKDVMRTKRCVSFSLDTGLLHLVERVGNSLPILLVVVDLSSKNAYFSCLNDYLEYVLKDDTKWRMQKYKTIHIPCENTLQMAQLLHWYSMRPKINSFFAQAAALASDVKYAATADDYINMVCNFSIKIQNSDIWNCTKLGFSFLSHAQKIVNCIVNAQYCEESQYLFQDCKANELFSMLSFDNLTFDQANKLFTASRLLESIENATSIYLSNIRQLFSVTAYDALVQT